MKFEFNWPIMVSEEEMFEKCCRMDGQWTYLQDGCSEIPNGNMPVQIYHGVNARK